LPCGAPFGKIGKRGLMTVFVVSRKCGGGKKSMAWGGGGGRKGGRGGENKGGVDARERGMRNGE